MEKDRLNILLNKYPVPCSFHESTLVNISVEDNKCKLRFIIGCYARVHSKIFKDIWAYNGNDDENMILDVVFDGITELNISNDIGKVYFIEVNNMENDHNNTITLNCEYEDNQNNIEPLFISFKFKSFKWEYINNCTYDFDDELFINTFGQCKI